MKAKIDEAMICIPPHISASWDQIHFIQSENDPLTGQMILVLSLKDGKEVRIPNLDPSLIDIAFSSHLAYLEKNKTQENRSTSNPLQQFFNLSPEQMDGMPFKMGIAGMPGMEQMEVAMQHNSKLADTPDLPKEVLEKISGIAKMVTGGDLEQFPKPEPHCNCTHCQLARAIHGMEKEEEVVADEELTFRSWDIKQSGDNLYTVTNPLNPEEQYSVFLGEPVGCTCGHPHCEHIKSVLLT